EDVVIDPQNPIASNIIFKTTIEDTSKPFVSSLNVLDNSHILIKFSEKINLENATIKIEKNETQTLPLITQIYPDSSKLILILLEKLDTKNKYQLTLSKITDLAGNELGEYIYEISGEFVDDTTAPTLIFSIPVKGENDVNLRPEIKLFFDDILLSEPKTQLFDSTGNEVKIKAKQNLNKLIIEPETELKPDEIYTLEIFEARDLNNNIQKDTLKLSFKTVNPSIFGAIEGNVNCEDTASSVIISALETSTGKKFTTKTKCNSKFTLEQIPQGRYLIEAFIDSNGNGTYDYGKVFPFVPSEKFTVYLDTVKVRARWTTENISIKF
ncbi:MAG: Ig-like domain-containing protein, partial [Candidatus Kryptonium sp.]